MLLTFSNVQLFWHAHMLCAYFETHFVKFDQNLESVNTTKVKSQSQFGFSSTGRVGVYQAPRDRTLKPVLIPIERIQQVDFNLIWSWTMEERGIEHNIYGGRLTAKSSAETMLRQWWAQGGEWEGQLLKKIAYPRNHLGEIQCFECYDKFTQSVSLFLNQNI